MAEPLPISYLNGEFVPLREARISPLDRGFLYSDGAYELIGWWYLTKPPDKNEIAEFGRSEPLPQSHISCKSSRYRQRAVEWLHKLLI